MNHITNMLSITSDNTSAKRVLEIFNAISKDQVGLGSIDFNKIIPAPNDIFHGDVGEEEREKYGEKTWLSFNLKNWGTKWNAYFCTKFNAAERQIEFCTAWAAPHQVIAKLAQIYPDVEFSHSWFSDDLGANVGAAIYQGKTKIYMFKASNYSKEAFELIANITGLDLEYDLNLLLSADESTYIPGDCEEYDLVSVCGHQMLYSKERLSKSDIPLGLYCYYLKEGKDGRCESIEPYNCIQHSGTLISNMKIDFEFGQGIPLSAEEAPQLLIPSLSFLDYLNECYEIIGEESEDYYDDI